MLLFKHVDGYQGRKAERTCSGSACLFMQISGEVLLPIVEAGAYAGRASGL